MKIKVCGLKNKENVHSLLDTEIDFFGFIFYEKSKRYILKENENLDFLKDIKSKVAVFVNESESNIKRYIEEYNFSLIQLHGNEKPNFCSQFKNISKIIKAFSIDENFDFSSLKEYENSVDFFLFDTKGKDYGGNGVSFDWNLLEKYQLSKKFFLSGGISIHDIEKIKKISHSSFYGIDINSKFETIPAMKNVPLIKDFLKKVRL